MLQVYSWAILIVAYLLGTLPFAHILRRFLDPERSFFRPVLRLLDILKGLASVLFAADGGIRLAEWLGAGYPEVPGSTLGWAAALCMMIGHSYSPWINFRGSKSMLPAFGAVLVLSPWAALAALVTYGTAYASLAGRPHPELRDSRSGLIALLLGCAVQLVGYPIGVHLWLAGALLFVVLMKHESDIDSLLELGSRG